MKEFIRDLASRGVVTCGLSALGRGLRRHEGATILYGHRFSDDDEGYLKGLRPAWFDAQLAYLTRHYEVIPLATLVRCLEQGREVPRRSVVLTLDDGFRDNLEQAFPVLERYRVPATLFVVTRSLTEGELPWSQRLGVLFQRTRVPEVSHALLGECPWPLADDRQRRVAYQHVKAAIAPRRREERDGVIELLANRLDVEPPRDRMLNWQDARLLQAGGVEIGGHGYSHALLGRVTPSEACREIARCKVDLENFLGLKTPAFCLPGGSFTSAVIERVRQSGFRSCFRPDYRKRRNNEANADPYTLSRWGLPNAPRHHLEAELDGPFHLLRQFYHRVPHRSRPL
ncbi:polysaccharide deacetylase family protein [Halomonas kalidii]|uniref:Polysaccharide deacetylase family protein n=1 Tax=Halomonas kalidii TaxID=3043293 RepID=A0ABT6VJL4_9GAMM|nr:polysaccharide deacetylase family protein [Halomonas kalidii]MDI5934164.1 polysaccharide deacetylase family protein [Halomonas kalidii]